MHIALVPTALVQCLINSGLDGKLHIMTVIASVVPHFCSANGRHRCSLFPVSREQQRGLHQGASSRRRGVTADFI